MDSTATPTTREVIIGTLRRLLDRRLLASTLNLFHRPALAHKKNGVPRGSEVYGFLYEEALAYASAHAETWGVSLADLHARLPALEHLRLLAARTELQDRGAAAPLNTTCNFPASTELA